MLIPIAIGAGTLYFLDQIGVSIVRKPLTAPRKPDFNACALDPTGNYRILRHDLRPAIQKALQQMTLRPIAHNGHPIPGWHSIQPLRNEQDVNAYHAVDIALKRGFWVAIRLDCLQDLNDGVLSFGTREETLKLVQGAQPFAILARPRERTAPVEKKEAKPAEQRQTSLDALYAAMPPEEQAKLQAYIAEQALRAQAEAVAQAQAAEYANHSQANGQNGKPPIDVPAVVVSEETKHA